MKAKSVQFENRNVLWADNPSDIQDSDSSYADVFCDGGTFLLTRSISPAADGQHDYNFNPVNNPPQCHISVTL